MRFVKIVIWGMIIISIALVIYMLADVFIKRRKLNKKEIDTVNNNKYVAIIFVLFVLFIVYGIIRNFQG